MSSLPFAGKIALVTGAAGLGVGTAIALSLAKKGAKVYLNGPDLAKLEQAAETIKPFTVRYDICVADISHPESVNNMINKIYAQDGGIDILINNAARGSRYIQTDQVTDQEWDDDISTILSGSFYCTRASLPSMIKNRWGKILFISSSAALVGTFGRGISYAAAKAGLHGMTKQLALELAEYNINVNTIAPNQILTPRTMKDGRKTKESILEYASHHIPLGRPAFSEDIAALATFLVTEEASYITGQIFQVDGGASLATKATAIRSPHNPVINNLFQTN